MCESFTRLSLHRKATDDLFITQRSLKEKAPSHPLIVDLEEKSTLFDTLMAKYQVPPRAVPA